MQRELLAGTRIRRPLALLVSFFLAIAVCTAAGAPAFARRLGQTAPFTRVYNSGVLTLGADQTLQLTIVNNNNLSDPAVPSLPVPESSCSFVAQFLDASGNILQKQQQTLAPGQSVSLTVNGPQTVQSRVDVSSGTESGFGAIIADQCPVSNEIVNTSSNDPVLFPPLTSTSIPSFPEECRQACQKDCAPRCQHAAGCLKFCVDECEDGCKNEFFNP
jgi:hypothetical protein